jgi:outer membrane protein assembly factor BamB
MGSRKEETFMTNEQRPDDLFAPEGIDERIEQILKVQASQNDSDIHLIHELQSTYQEDADILARARARLFQNVPEMKSTASPVHPLHGPITENKIVDYRRYNRMKQHTLQPERAVTRHFALVAAIIFATFLVGSMAGLAYFAHHASSQTTTVGATNKAVKQQNSQQTAQNTTPGIYVGSTSSVIRMDAQSGKVIWTYKLPGATPDMLKVPRVIPEGDTVYIELMGSKNVKSAVVALDTQSGKARWSHQFDATGQISDLTIADGMVYGSVNFNPERGNSPSAAPGAGTANGTAKNKASSIVYALNASDGTEHSNYQFDREILEHITISDGVLYGMASHTLNATRLNDSKQLWSITTNNDNQIIAGPHVANGVVYTTILNLADTSGNGMRSVIAAFKADSGTKIWQSDPIGRGPFGMTLVNNMIYVGSDDGTLYAYDAQKGNRIWSHPTTGSIQSTPFVVDGIVYASEDVSFSASETVVAVDANSGQEKWHASVNGGASILFVNNGVVYIACDDTTYYSSKFYTLKAADGSQHWNTSITGNVNSMIVIP